MLLFLTSTIFDAIFIVLGVTPKIANEIDH